MFYMETVQGHKLYIVRNVNIFTLDILSGLLSDKLMLLEVS